MLANCIRQPEWVLIHIILQTATILQIIVITAKNLTCSDQMIRCLQQLPYVGLFRYDRGCCYSYVHSKNNVLGTDVQHVTPNTPEC